jgi:glycosyltransferase involved in cell wall biosynthesis
LAHRHSSYTSRLITSPYVAERRKVSFRIPRLQFQLKAIWSDAELIAGKKIIVVMPAYNASRRLSQTYSEIPKEFVDDILLVDDGSVDDTFRVARKLGIQTVRHDANLGYGGNQKTCYKRALELHGDIIIMLHPDYQYTPTLIPAIASLLAYGPYDVVLGSRILTGGALKGGMPYHRYVFNRVLTAIQNLLGELRSLNFTQVSEGSVGMF